MNKLLLTTKQTEKETPSTLLRMAEEVKLAQLANRSILITMSRRPGKSNLVKMLKNNG